MSVESRKPFGFKILMNYILEEIQDDSLFDGLWKSIDAFNSSYGNAEYPIDDQPPIPIPFDFRYADITYIENFFIRRWGECQILGLLNLSTSLS